MGEGEQRQYGQPPSAHSWRHQYTLAPKHGIPFDLIEVSAPVLDLPSRS